MSKCKAIIPIINCNSKHIITTDTLYWLIGNSFLPTLVDRYSSGATVRTRPNKARKSFRPSQSFKSSESKTGRSLRDLIITLLCLWSIKCLLFLFNSLQRIPNSQNSLTSSSLVIFHTKKVEIHTSTCKTKALTIQMVTILVLSLSITFSA